MKTNQFFSSSDLLNLGNRYLREHDFVEARSAFEKALDLGAVDSEYHLGLGRALSALGSFPQAHQSFQAAITTAPEKPENHYFLGCHLMKFGQWEMALSSFQRLLVQIPDYRDTALRFSHCLTRLRFLPPVNLEPDLIQILLTGNFEDLALAPIIASVITRQHGIGVRSGTSESWCGVLEEDQLVSLYLNYCFNVNADIEKVLKQIRHFLFFQPPQRLTNNPKRWRFCIDLSIVFLNSEYVYSYENEEKLRLENHLSTIQNICKDYTTKIQDLTPLIVGVSMYDMPPIEALTRLAHEEPDDEATRRFLHIFYEERQVLLAEEIASLGVIENSISHRVKHQYERFPFPQWRSMSPESPRDFQEDMCNHFPFLNNKTIETLPDILVVGCGTGQEAIRLAERYRHQSFVAIDLSFTSLAYAQKKARDRGCNHIQFFQADIFSLDHWPRHFHLIQAVGVLHHTSDPFEAWKILRSLLLPGGWMKLGLYSAVARREITHARHLLKKKGYQPTIRSMRAFRDEILDGNESPSFDFLKSCTDFYNMSHLRDMLFHECEYLFDLDQIESTLDQMNLKFAGFSLKQPEVLQRFNRRFPDDPRGLLLSNWKIFEEEFPDTFLEMYRFWCKG